MGSGSSNSASTESPADLDSGNEKENGLIGFTRPLTTRNISFNNINAKISAVQVERPKTCEYAWPPKITKIESLASLV